jgi:ubiquinone/menaquinone biosynthesis C-methylase UbiE
VSRFDLFASRYDLGMLPLEWLLLRRLRRRIFPALRGRVLELGAGTGVNLPLYRSGAEVVAVDQSSEMLALARRRRRQAPISWVQADAQALPFADATFQQVMTSLLFCSVPDPLQGLQEIRRVLTPGGWLVMLEHVRGERGSMRLLTDWLERPWHRLSQSCHLNRETARLVAESGLRVVCASRHGLGIFQMIVAVKSEPDGPRGGTKMPLQVG